MLKKQTINIRNDDFPAAEKGDLQLGIDQLVAKDIGDDYDSIFGALARGVG